MTEDVERLRETLNQLIDDMSDVEPKPSQWSGWIVRLLESLDIKAAEMGKEAGQGYKDMLNLVRGAINQRLEQGRWD